MEDVAGDGTMRFYCVLLHRQHCACQSRAEALGETAEPLCENGDKNFSAHSSEFLKILQ